jgi:hypothetical protein
MLISASAYSQQTGKDEKQPTGREHAGTKTNPFMVKIVPTQKDASETKREEEERAAKQRADDRKQKNDDDLTKFTGDVADYTDRLFWIGAIQAGILCLTVWFIWRQEDSTRVIERAYIFVEVSLEQDIQASPSGVNNIIAIKLLNHGKTPSEIAQIRATTVLSKTVPQELHDSPGSHIAFPPGLGIAQNTHFEIGIRVRVTKEELGDIQHSRQTLYCVGLVTYRDIFNKERDTGFCWFYRHQIQEARFAITPESRLNKRT